MRSTDVKIGAEYAANPTGRKYGGTFKFVPLNAEDAPRKGYGRALSGFRGTLGEGENARETVLASRLILEPWDEWVRRNDEARRRREEMEAAQARREAENERRTTALRESGDLERVLALIGSRRGRRGEHDPLDYPARDLATRGMLQVYLDLDVIEHLAALIPDDTDPEVQS